MTIVEAREKFERLREGYFVHGLFGPCGGRLRVVTGCGYYFGDVTLSKAFAQVYYRARLQGRSPMKKSSRSTARSKATRI